MQAHFTDIHCSLSLCCRAPDLNDLHGSRHLRQWRSRKLTRSSRVSHPVVQIYLRQTTWPSNRLLGRVTASERVMRAFLMGKSLTPKLEERLILQGSRTRLKSQIWGSANGRKQEA